MSVTETADAAHSRFTRVAIATGNAGPLAVVAAVDELRFDKRIGLVSSIERLRAVPGGLLRHYCCPRPGRCGHKRALFSCVHIRHGHRCGFRASQTTDSGCCRGPMRVRGLGAQNQYPLTYCIRPSSSPATLPKRSPPSVFSCTLQIRYLCLRLLVAPVGRTTQHSTFH
ncbi:hypothetical protein OE88DRAFT_1156666 [Heliocybe sulcata]|uniref:Uncharacterized protein n=1 Tax=Heliocybe sulcata TaxID=5364 RepID=A0A5C3N8H6_9AGAM|nr:hypothetical protein OE88DRAFT_1156666 [Heliocybe sulcata]